MNFRKYITLFILCFSASLWDCNLHDSQGDPPLIPTDTLQAQDSIVLSFWKTPSDSLDTLVYFVNYKDSAGLPVLVVEESLLTLKHERSFEEVRRLVRTIILRGKPGEQTKDTTRTDTLDLDTILTRTKTVDSTMNWFSLKRTILPDTIYRKTGLFPLALPSLTDTIFFPNSYENRIPFTSPLKNWKLVAEDWSGTVVVSDTDLAFQLPPDSINLNPTVVGPVFGKIRFAYTNAELHDIPIRIWKFFGGFSPTDNLFTRYWKEPLNPMQILSGMDFFSLTTLVSTSRLQDSSAMVRSQFTLTGDLDFEVQIRLPENLRSGYSVSVFLSKETNPLFHYLSPNGNFKGGYDVYAEAAGISFNGEISGSEVRAFSFYSRSSFLGVMFQNDDYLRIKKRKESLLFSKRRENGPYTEIENFDYSSGPTLPDTLHIFFALGNFNTDKRDVSVTWKRFKMLEGRMELP